MQEGCGVWLDQGVEDEDEDVYINEGLTVVDKTKIHHTDTIESDSIESSRSGK